MRGLGKLFKKLGMSYEDDLVQDSPPQVRPITVTNEPTIGRTTRIHHNIPLAPAPPINENQSFLTPDPPAAITSSYSHYGDALHFADRSYVNDTTARGYQHGAYPATNTTTTTTTVTTNTFTTNEPSRTDLNSNRSRPLHKVFNDTGHYLQPTGEHDQTEADKRATRQSRDTVRTTEDTHDNSRWSNASTRKSSGSNSIYSTFGPESYPSSETIFDDKYVQEKECEKDLTQIVAENMQRRNPARVVVETDPTEYGNRMPGSFTQDIDSDTDTDGEDDEGNDDDDDIFVDATGPSQEDIEREKKEARLSKRLSGGHYGSAGGLLFSIIPPPTPVKSQHRRSRPPPEDVAHSMLKWKRQSTGRFSAKSTDQESLTVVIETEDELSVPEKDTLRVKTEEALTGSNRLIPTPSSSVDRKSRRESLNSFSDVFSKDAWTVPDLHIDITCASENNTTDSCLREEEDDDQKSCETSEAKEASRRLWEEDSTFVPREQIAEWLGQGKPLNAKTLIYYMEYFQFSSMRLDAAFRKLCSKLYFKAEAQQIDRILEVFAKRFWRCNSTCIFGSADVVYAVVYSLLLLNTDLHVAQGNHARMTRQAFVKNTMSTIRDQRQGTHGNASVQLSKVWEADMETCLKELYISVKQYQILQPLSNRPNNKTTTLEKRVSILGGRRVADMKRSMGAMMGKAVRESMLIPDEVQPRPSTSSGRQRPSSPPLARSPRRDSFSSVASSKSYNSLAVRGGGGGSTGATLSPHYQPMIHFMDTHSSALFSSQPPYLKEGVVVRKHLLENANQKAKHREWREIFLVVSQGELKMYALQGSSSDTERRSMLRASSASLANLADSFTKNSSSGPASFGGVQQNRWAAHSHLIGTIKLNHSLSNVLPPPGYNRQRPDVFAIQQPHGGVYLFQAASREQVNEWVATCNYWAARESKEPLQGGVSNMEYGWGSCLNDVILNLDAADYGGAITGRCLQDADTVMVYDWRAPTPPMVPSTLDESEQYNTLQKHLTSLNDEINDHRELKKKILIKASAAINPYSNFPSKSQNHTKVMANWESKSKYMLHEIIKYQNYCNVLEKSMERRKEQQRNQDEDSNCK
ncbi:hypothetical protein DFQ28_002963 [Apophysomyces sp. BC1034]|nr:hypothetical protein DFQ29_000015 [Apophysomyces sp. BC1021]KAG0183630.1 hypothetical protein DFQ29_000055 [Apophysomyces sp. BC1021]KAG0194888.1 hypothetical protein DFQ28_002963 [Apophysomyces sp. BC1034]